MKFKVGDRIKQIKDGYGTSREDMGKEAIVQEIGLFYFISYKKDGIRIKRIGKWEYNQNTVGEEGFELINIGIYENTKRRILALDNGWNKEADDVVNLLYEHTNLRIWVDNYGIYGNITIVTHGSKLFDIAIDKEVGYKTQYKAHFTFNGQCDKMEKFRECLLWLLDNSSLKDEKEEKRVKLQEEIAKLQEKIVAKYMKILPIKGEK